MYYKIILKKYQAMHVCKARYGVAYFPNLPVAGRQPIPIFQNTFFFYFSTIT